MSQLAPEEALAGAEVELDWWSLVGAHEDEAEAAVAGA